MKLRKMRIAVALSLLGFTACTSVETPDGAASQAAATESAQEKAASARPLARFTPATKIDAYKAQAARHIVDKTGKTFDGELPPILKSVVVLDISVDREGRPTRVVVDSSNGFKALERTAIDSVKRAGAFPAPTKEVLAGKSEVRYLETWLFRSDGKFQIRSLVTAPQPGADRIVLASGKK